MCQCQGTRKERMKNWVVVDRNCNYSHFETPKAEKHYSDYSLIKCNKCNGYFRTKADYVDSLSDKN